MLVSADVSFYGLAFEFASPEAFAQFLVRPGHSSKIADEIALFLQKHPELLQLHGSPRVRATLRRTSIPFFTERDLTPRNAPMSFQVSEPSMSPSASVVGVHSGSSAYILLRRTHSTVQLLMTFSFQLSALHMATSQSSRLSWPTINFAVPSSLNLCRLIGYRDRCFYAGGF